MKVKINDIFNKYFYFFIGITIIFPVYFYIIHILNDYKLLNEYKYFDEITILDTKKEVKNSDYIRENLFFNPNELEKFSSSKNIFFFNNKPQNINFSYIPDSIVLTDEKIHAYQEKLKNKSFNFPHIEYSKELNMLYSDYIDYCNNELPLAFINDKKLEKYFSKYPAFQANDIDKLKEKLEFYKSNIYEQNLQTLDRFYFHENSFVLSPINEINLGRENKEIFSQYGFLSISLINKVMKLYGDFSINNYEKSKKTLDLIYYIIFVLFILFFFNSNYLRFIFILLLGISLFGNSYYTFSYAPTVTNTRHLLDLFIIYLLFLYNSNLKKIYLFFASFLSVLSILFAKDFGQFLFLSIEGVLTIMLIKNYIEFKKIDLIELLNFVLTTVLGFIAFKYYPMMENPSIKYFLDGFYSFPFQNNLIYFIILLIVFIQWLFLVLFYDRLRNNYLLPYIFVIMYTQFLYTYFIWHGTINNVIMYSYIFVLPLSIGYYVLDFKYKKVVSIISILCLIVIYCFSLTNFIIGKNNYDNVFKTHKLYKWEHPRAGGIIATYSFDYFQDSINLIKKYNSSNKIYMISKYDNILAILSEKYSGFPFFELRSTIVTKDEFESIKNQILNEANDILYVDNDIERDFDKEIKELNVFTTEKYWRDENIKQRIPKLKVLKELFEKIKDNYELIEEGKLISVYKKK